MASSTLTETRNHIRYGIIIRFLVGFCALYHAVPCLIALSSDYRFFQPRPEHAHSLPGINVAKLAGWQDYAREGRDMVDTGPHPAMYTL